MSTKLHFPSIHARTSSPTFKTPLTAHWTPPTWGMIPVSPMQCIGDARPALTLSLRCSFPGCWGGESIFSASLGSDILGGLRRVSSWLLLVVVAGLIMTACSQADEIQAPGEVLGPTSTSTLIPTTTPALTPTVPTKAAAGTPTVTPTPTEPPTPMPSPSPSATLIPEPTQTQTPAPSATPLAIPTPTLAVEFQSTDREGLWAGRVDNPNRATLNSSWLARG